MIYQKAHENDKKVLEEVNTKNIKKLFCDGNYITGKRIKEYEDNGKKLMGYIQAESTAKPKGFRFSDFKINLKNSIK